MLPDDKLVYGILGTAIGAVGTGLSITEIQAIISIIITVSGFLISVVLPLVIKLVNKIKKAKEDGVVTKEEMDDIIETGKEIIDSTGKFIEDQKKEEKEDKKSWRKDHKRIDPVGTVVKDKIDDTKKTK